MAGNIYVAEFSQAFVDTSGAIQMATVPPLAEYTVASGATSAAFNAATRYIRVNVDSGFTSPAAAQIEIGASPSIVAGSMRLAINQTEYFRVQAGYKIACGTVAA